MAEVEWAMMCDYAFKDNGNKTCLIGIFDRIFSQGVPTALNRASLALKVVGEPKEKVEVKIEIVRPTGGVLATLQAGAELGDSGAVEVQAAIQNLPLPDWGLYGFNLYLDSVLSPKTLTVTLAEPPSQPKS